MKFRTLLAITLLSVGLITSAQGEVVSLAHEVALSNFRAPANENGTAAFKECSDCKFTVARVTARTQYKLNGKSVRLADFRQALSKVEKRDNVPVIVLHHLKSDTIESIAVSL